MLYLNRIHIEFDRTILENEEIRIPDGKITAITGRSGCGKTSLLYSIGLMSSREDYTYQFDSHSINLKSDRDVSAFRKTKIGYVFQENSLFDTLSIKENIRYAARIAGIAITDEEIAGYLNYVELTHVDSSNYPKTLSGGEQQRLAIACAIAKKPELIIADEPTSALDKENSAVILKIFRKFVEDSSRKVVIASHNAYVYTQADVVYEIVDKHISLRSGETDVQVSRLDDRDRVNCKTDRVMSASLSFGFLLGYALKSRRNMRWQKNFMIILCAVATAVTVCVSTIGAGIMAYQEDLLSRISNKEIFLVNNTATGIPLDMDTNLSIPQEKEDRIKEISFLDKVYSYFEFRLTGYDIDNDRSLPPCNAIVNIDGRIQEYMFDSESGSEYNNILIVPYYPGQPLENQLDIVTGSRNPESVYLSHELAHLLGIDDTSQSVSLKVSLGVPVHVTEIELTSNNGEFKQKGDVDLSRIVTFDLSVSGVLNESFINRYSASGDCLIYMPIAKMQDIMEETQINFVEGDNPFNIVYQEWSPSAYVIFVKTWNDISGAIEKLKSIDGNFSVTSQYQDVESMNKLIKNIRDISLWIGLVVLSVLFILTAIIYTNYVLSRKYEVAILKANGLNRKEILKLILIEALVQVGMISLLACSIALVLSQLVNMVADFRVAVFGIPTFLLILLIAMASVLIPTIGSGFIMNRIKPDRVIRN